MRIIMVSPAFKNRTRDEVIAAFRESIRKKQEWIKQSDEEFKRIREERKLLAHESTRPCIHQPPRPLQGLDREWL